jgi:hypothetical protein
MSCTVSVTFTPTGAGTVSGDVPISDNGGGSPQQVSLSGTGVQTSGCPNRCYSCSFCVNHVRYCRVPGPEGVCICIKETC